VTYGDNNKGKILGKGTVGNENNFLIHDVFYVEGLTGAERQNKCDYFEFTRAAI